MKNKILFTLGLMLLLLPIKINASEGSLTIVCDKTQINAGQSTSCTVSGTTDVSLTKITASIELSSDKLNLTSFDKGSSWDEGGASNGNLTLTSSSGISGNFNLGTFVITAKEGTSNEDERFYLNDVKFFVAEDDKFSVNVEPAEIIIADTENSLSALSIKTSDGTEILTNFNKDTTSYDLNVDGSVNKVVVTPTKASDTIFSVSGGGEKTLNYGANVIEITVTSQSRVEKLYTININREDGRSSEKNLLRFSFNNYDLDFSKDVLNYVVILDNNVKELALCGESYENANVLCINTSYAYSDKASISMLYNGNLIEISDIDDYKTIGSIDVGDNTLSVVITAENESKNTYNFTIQRKDENNKLPEKPSNKEINNNGGTGDAGIITVIVLLVVSLGIIIYMNKDEIIKKFKKQ